MDSDIWKEKRNPHSIYKLFKDWYLKQGKWLHHYSIVFYQLKEELPHTFIKCFSPASKIRSLQIIADPLKIRGQVQVVDSIGVTTPELNEEIEEEVGDITALPSPDGSTGK